jgi:hypothetical protein
VPVTHDREAQSHGLKDSDAEPAASLRASERQGHGPDGLARSAVAGPGVVTGKVT